MDATTLAGRSLVVIARRWFDRTYGNSYYTARVVVDGRDVATVRRTYGHGEGTYRNEAVRVAKAAGVEGLPEDDDYRSLVDAGWTVLVEETRVARRKDLHEGGRM
jgi:hypothetical protein